MKRPLCNGCKKRPKTIANDVKEKYKTSPPQTCGKKEYNFVMDLAILRIERDCKIARFPEMEKELEYCIIAVNKTGEYAFSWTRFSCQ